MSNLDRSTSVVNSLTVSTSGTLAFAPNGGPNIAYELTLTGNGTISIGSPMAGVEQVISVDIIQGGTAGFAPTFSNVVWSGGAAPSFNTSAGKQDTLAIRGVGYNIVGVPLALGYVPSAAPAAPSAPTGLTLSAGNQQVSVSCNPVTANPAVTGYTIKRGTSPGGESSTPIASNVSLPYLDTGLTNGTTYYYEVSAVNSVGTGAYSSESSATPAGVAHYGTFAPSGSTIGSISAPYASAFNPGANLFEIQTCVEMPTFIVGGTQTNNLVGSWSVNAPGQMAIFYLLPTGILAIAWTNGAGVGVATASAVVPSSCNGNVTYFRVTLVPTTGVTNFYYGTDGSTWTQLGTTVTGTPAGAVSTPSSPVPIIIGSESGVIDASQGAFTGRWYSSKWIVNGSVVANPIAGSAGVSDSCGYNWTAAHVAFT